MSFLELITIVVDDYDTAIAFFVDVLGFELIADRGLTVQDERRAAEALGRGATARRADGHPPRAG